MIKKLYWRLRNRFEVWQTVKKLPLDFHGGLLKTRPDKKDYVFGVWPFSFKPKHQALSLFPKKPLF